MARIVRIHQPGGPEALQIDEVDVRAPGPGEVSITVHAIGMNRAETYMRKGFLGTDPSGITHMGGEACGIVDAVGPGVDAFRPGDAVCLMSGMYSPLPYGSYGETIIAPATSLTALPNGLTAIEGAALWTGYMVAYAPMVEIAKVFPGDFVILNAATSSVGVAAIQIVNKLGGVPIAMTRDRTKAERLKALGAAHVIISGEEDYVERVKEITGGKMARVVFDPVSGPGVEKLFEGVCHGGILIIYGMLSMQPASVSPAMVVKHLVLTGYAVDMGANPERRARGEAFVREGLASGELKVIVDQTFPFDEIRAAHEALESDQHVGKIVVVTKHYQG